jgi:hypothetical protein
LFLLLLREPLRFLDELLPIRRGHGLLQQEEYMVHQKYETQFREFLVVVPSFLIQALGFDPIPRCLKVQVLGWL